MNNWKNKRVFVSGGSGVIGTALVNHLLNQGATLFVGDLKPQPENWDSEIHRYREGDLMSLAKEEILDFNPEIFFHLAAAFERSIETKDFWEENFHHNIALSHHLMTLQKDLPSLKKVVFASSYLIYNPDKYLFNTPQHTAIPLGETEHAAPRNLCGMAKMLHEQELLFIKKFRPELQIINARIFRSYGKNSRDIISRWIRTLLKNEEINVYRPEGRFDFVFAEDVALALQKLAETDFSGTVNISNGKSRSILEVLNVLKTHFQNMKYKNEISDIPYEASQADITLFNQLVNNFKFKDIEETIPEIIAFEKTK
jgi:carbamoyl-phosphate synthase large subunit